MDAKVPVIQKFQFRAPRDLRVPEVRLAPGSFGPVERDLRMGSVTERFIPGTAAPAEGVLLLKRIVLHHPPGAAVPLVIVADLLLREGTPPLTI
jgi:hypothetical protein